VAAIAVEKNTLENSSARLKISHAVDRCRAVPADWRTRIPLIRLIVQTYEKKSSFFFIYIEIEDKASVVLRYISQAYSYYEY
jgi:hypothetical protein